MTPLVRHSSIATLALLVALGAFGAIRQRRVQAQAVPLGREVVACFQAQAKCVMGFSPLFASADKSCGEVELAGKAHLEATAPAERLCTSSMTERLAAAEPRVRDAVDKLVAAELTLLQEQLRASADNFIPAMEVFKARCPAEAARLVSSFDQGVFLPLMRSRLSALETSNSAADAP